MTYLLPIELSIVLDSELMTNFVCDSQLQCPLPWLPWRCQHQQHIVAIISRRNDLMSLMGGMMGSRTSMKTIEWCGPLGKKPC